MIESDERDVIAMITACLDYFEITMVVSKIIARFQNSHLVEINFSNQIKVIFIWSFFSVHRIVFAHFFVMNLVLWYKGSSAAVPFLTLVELLALWFLVSVPLTFVGAFLGFRKRAIEHPVRTNQIPRQIPDQSFYTHVSTKRGTTSSNLWFQLEICSKQKARHKALNVSWSTS